jgi:hypothetical protein
VQPTSGPPLRPDEASAQRVAERRWLPVIAVVAVIGIVAFGAGGSASGAAGPPVDVAGVVRFQPEPGWEVVDRADDATVHRVRLRAANTLLDVYAVEGFDRSPSELAAVFQDEILSAQLDQLTIGGSGDVTLPSGLAAVVFGYVGVSGDGVSVEGVVTATVGTEGNGAIFDGFAPQGELAARVGDLRSMIDGAAVT